MTQSRADSERAVADRLVVADWLVVAKPTMALQAFTLQARSFTAEALPGFWGVDSSGEQKGSGLVWCRNYHTQSWLGQCGLI